MRDKIRLPADVEFSTKFLNMKDGDGADEGQAQFHIEAVPHGKFSRILKVTVVLPGLGEVITIVPKSRDRKPTP